MLARLFPNEINSPLNFLSYNFLFLIFLFLILLFLILFRGYVCMCIKGFAVHQKRFLLKKIFDVHRVFPNCQYGDSPYKSIECLHQLLKSRHLFVVLLHLILIMVFQTWNHGKKKKRKAILLLAYIALMSAA